MKIFPSRLINNSSSVFQFHFFIFTPCLYKLILPLANSLYFFNCFPKLTSNNRILLLIPTNKNLWLDYIFIFFSKRIISIIGFFFYFFLFFILWNFFFFNFIQYKNIMCRRTYRIFTINLRKKLKLSLSNLYLFFIFSWYISNKTIEYSFLSFKAYILNP